MAGKRRIKGSYIVYAVRANVPHRARKLKCLTELGSDKLDLLHATHERLAAFGDSYIDREDEGLTIQELRPDGRTLFIRAVRGQVGSPGTVYDRDTGKHTRRTERQPALNELRAFFVLPEGSVYGLLFVEVQGNKHLKDVVDEYAITPIAKATKMTINLGSWGEAADWKKDLAGKVPLRVTETLDRESNPGGTSEVETTRARVVIEGRGMVAKAVDVAAVVTGRAERRDEEHRALYRAAILDPETEEERQALAEVAELRKAKPVVSDVEAALGDYMPIAARQDFVHKTWTIGFGTDHKTDRTVILERGGLPQFRYETAAARLLDSDLLTLWRGHAVDIYQRFFDPLPSGYDVGRWPHLKSAD
jgi:hypothetical protein